MGIPPSTAGRLVLLGMSLVLLGLECVDEGPCGGIGCPVSDWQATLTGANQVPPVTTNAAGTGTFHLSGTNAVTYTIAITTLPATAITSAALHQGASNANGGVAVGLCGTGGAGVPACVNPGAPGVLSTGTITVSAAQLTQMRAFGMYANVSTVGNPNGEIRGQLRIVVP